MKYRIVYWLGSMKTECYITAESEEDAVKKFKERKGEMTILKVEEE